LANPSTVSGATLVMTSAHARTASTDIPLLIWVMMPLAKTFLVAARMSGIALNSSSCMIRAGPMER